MAAFEIQNVLNGSFPPRAFTDDNCSLVVLQTGSYDLASAGRKVVDQYDDWNVLGNGLARRRFVTAAQLSTTSVGAHDPTLFDK